MKKRPLLVPVLVLSALFLNSCKDPAGVAFGIKVEAEEIVYEFEPANNGSDPMWCHGNTCIVRYGDKVFVSGMEILRDQPPRLNTRWMMYERTEAGWELLFKDEKDRTREPSPLGLLGNAKVLLSVNPTLTAPGVENGPAEPRILQFDADEMLAAYDTLMPVWEGSPQFTEHSYRSFAIDAVSNEFILFQNVGETNLAWTFRDGEGNWVSQGILNWPWGDIYEEPLPVRICYPAVQLRDREVHFLGVSDIREPVKAWKDHKFNKTGRKWDFDFRRLFYTYTKDIESGSFQDWIELASREETAGHIFPCDLWLAPGGMVHILWTERALDERLRDEFFPDEKQTYALNYAIIKDGEVMYRHPVMFSEEEDELRPGNGRFQVTPENRLFVFYNVHNKTRDFQENRLVEIFPDHSLSVTLKAELKRPFSRFYTATVRAGSEPSEIIDVFGMDEKNEMRYARIRILTGGE